MILSSSVLEAMGIVYKHGSRVTDEAGNIECSYLALVLNIVNNGIMLKVTITNKHFGESVTGFFTDLKDFRKQANI